MFLLPMSGCWLAWPCWTDSTPGHQGIRAQRWVAKRRYGHTGCSKTVTWKRFRLAKECPQCLFWYTMGPKFIMCSTLWLGILVGRANLFMCLFSLWYIHFQVLFVQVRKGFALCDSCIPQTLDFVQVFRWELADAAWWVSMECRLKVGSLFGLATAFPVDLLTVKGTNWTKTYLCSWRWTFLKLSELPPQKGKPFWDMVYI